MKVNQMKTKLAKKILKKVLSKDQASCINIINYQFLDFSSEITSVVKAIGD